MMWQTPDLYHAAFHIKQRLFDLEISQYINIRGIFHTQECLLRKKTCFKNNIQSFKVVDLQI